jgi:predicted Zn-dependent peptidase
MPSSHVKTHTFPNGFRLIYQSPINKIPTAHINVFCHVGSANEDTNSRGAAHFIEHMCFQGTKTRHTSREIELDIDKVGSNFNAHTDKQFTWYEINCLDKHVPTSVDILSDMMLHSTFNKTSYAREMNVVIEENVRDLTDYTNMMFDEVDALLYKGSIYAYPVDSLQFHTKKGSLKYKNVVDFYKRYYYPANMIISITTRIPFGDIVKLIERTAFTMNPPVPTFNIIQPMILEPHTDSKYRLHCHNFSNMKSVNMAISFRVCNLYNTVDVYGLKFLENLIGGRFTSRLFTILREKHGLTYQSGVSCAFYENAGGFTIYIVSDSKKLLKNGANDPGVIPLIIDMLNNLLTKGVTQEEIDTTKGFLRGSIEIDLEDANTQSYYNGSRLLLTNEVPVPLEQLYSTYYAGFSRKDATRLLHTYFKQVNMCVAIVGGGIPPETLLHAEFAKFRG